MSMSTDSEILFVLQQSSQTSNKVDISEIITWQKNQACQELSSIASNPILDVDGVTKNETKEMIVRF